MKYKLLYIIPILIMSLQATTGSAVDPHPDWQHTITVENLWQQYPDRVRELFNNLNLEYPGLEPVKSALNDGDTVLAGENLVDYYRNASTSSWLRSRVYEFENPEEKQQASRLLEGIVTFDDVASKVPLTEKGGWQWTYTGPNHDDEYGYSINGHKYFPLFIKGWHETGNPAYVQMFDRLVRDWIIHNPLPEPPDSIYLVHQTTTEQLDWRDIGEVVWRDLEAGRRLANSWPQTFFAFQQQDEFTPAARLLMLASVPVQTGYLREFHKHRHNWTTIEMDGLALAGLTFPEFKEADQWVDYALKVMVDEINGQVYPDGTQTELSTKTQWVSLSRFESLLQNFRDAGRQVPTVYLERIEDMYNYMAYSMRPDGHQPLNNDSDREDLRPRVLKAAKEFDRPDWVYIATNGTEGKKPEGLPSTVFPWAGIHLMRNGWDQQSHWAFFDAGPYGTGHQHRDMLHLSIAAYGRDLLVDGGRYTHKDYFSFDPANWRGYFRSSFSHNVILVDGQGQQAGPLTTDQPSTEGTDYVNYPDFHFARGTFDSGYDSVSGIAEHSRAVFYVRDKFWVVVDHISTDRPRKLKVLWHFNPECNTLVQNNNEVVSNDQDQGNLRIVPVGNLRWQLELISGKTEPYIQGWYSETYGKKEPNPTAVYATDIKKDAIFAWVLLPAHGEVPAIKAIMLNPEQGKIKISVQDEKEIIITAPPIKGDPELDL